MALRNIRKIGDTVLRQECRKVEKIDNRLLTLIEDMIDTMYDADGVGLAAPQVGILKRLFVIDIGDGPLVFINPEILETSGSQTGEMKKVKNSRLKVKNYWQGLYCMNMII